MTFLTNPRGRKSRAPGRAAQRRHKRRPPAGFASWSAYMDSIRPKRKKTAKTRRASSKATTTGTRKRRAASTARTSSKSTTMAKKKHHTKRRHTRRHARRLASVAATQHRRRRHRRNPAGFKIPKLASVIPFATQAGISAAEAVAGKIVARKVRSITGRTPGSPIAAAIEAGVGLAGGLVLQSVDKNLGTMFAVGALMAPLETAIQRLGIPHISDSLGDDGFYLGDALGLTVDESQVGSYESQPDGISGYYVQ